MVETSQRRKRETYSRNHPPARARLASSTVWSEWGARASRLSLIDQRHQQVLTATRSPPQPHRSSTSLNDKLLLCHRLKTWSPPFASSQPLSVHSSAERLLCESPYELIIQYYLCLNVCKHCSNEIEKSMCSDYLWAMTNTYGAKCMGYSPVCCYAIKMHLFSVSLDNVKNIIKCIIISCEKPYKLRLDVNSAPEPHPHAPRAPKQPNLAATSITFLRSSCRHIAFRQTRLYITLYGRVGSVFFPQANTYLLPVSLIIW